jgi:signal transduction histidine kinase
MPDSATASPGSTTSPASRIHLLVGDDAERRALGALLDEGGYEYAATADLETVDDLGDADLFLVDDHTLPDVREPLLAEKRARAPEFCPVVLIRREETQIAPELLSRGGDDDDDEPRTVNETVVAPVDKSVLFRRLSNLLVRQRQTRELAERNERLDAFAGKISHELRNPLNVLSGRLDLARETGDDAHFEAMEQSLDRIQRLVEDVLSLARTGDVEVDPEPLALSAVVERCWETVDASAATLRVETTGTVVADEDRLHQLLANLVRNAIEHNGGSVTVTVGDLDDGFFVADDGVGIPADERGQILERGYSGSGHGTGLGLAVVAEIASAHGWNVAVTDSEDGGARFEFWGVERAET